jgi:hypothetical protein
MTRTLLVAAAIIASGVDVVACGGDLVKLSVDADAPFDLDAHWNECCFWDAGIGDCGALRGGDTLHGSSSNWSNGKQCLGQYCGVHRDRCPDGSHNPSECDGLDDPPFLCCGVRLLTQEDGAPPGWTQEGIELDCLPEGLDDGSGL